MRNHRDIFAHFVGAHPVHKGLPSAVREGLRRSAERYRAQGALLRNSERRLWLQEIHDV